MSVPSSNSTEVQAPSITRISCMTPSYEPQRHSAAAPSQRAQFDSVQLERKLGRIIPNVAASWEGHTPCIETKLTHTVDDEKTRYFKRAKTSAIEIDVSDLPRNATCKTIRQLVIEGCEGKKWIYSARAVGRTRKYPNSLFVPCPLPTSALLSNLLGNGWKSSTQPASLNALVEAAKVGE